MQKIYVTCSVCGRVYQAIVPKGGDGSMFVPRKHKMTVATKYVSPINGSPIYKREVCSGSWREGIDIK